MANRVFEDPGTFLPSSPYELMPFRFGVLPNGQILATTHAGEFIILNNDEFERYVSRQTPAGTRIYQTLNSKGFLVSNPNNITIRIAASQWRTKKAFLEDGPKLHIFVPTLRCNHSCGYCQASRSDAHACGVDMSEATASRAIDLMLAAPTPTPTMEFQGGEPLLAFPLVQWMVREASARAARLGKSISYVICTNLTLLTDEHLQLFKEFNVAVSTSVDGPAELHNRNRPMGRGENAHAVVMANIERCRSALGEDSVSALMTATANSLKHSKEIIDEYVRLGQKSIFLRELNPYGYAAKTAGAIGYKTKEFVEFYKESFAYIVRLNKEGTFISEGYATILLKKILTPFGVGFVDLQSPTGEGFGVVLYNHDGSVYASDEGRMLGEMGDRAFRLGAVADSYSEIFFGETMQAIAAAGVAEALPGCADCVFVPYCGADPIRHYRTQGDLVGHKPTSSFCEKQKAIFEFIFSLLVDADEAMMNIFLSWISPRHQQVPRPTWLS